MNLLTVGIVSYNRPFELKRTIKSLFPLPECVNVLICDDNSPKINDILFEINDLINYSDKIKFRSNDKNLGYDRNLYKVIQEAESKYVFLIGDDDYLEEGALKNILNFISNNNDFKCGFVRYIDKKIISRNFNSNLFFDKNTINNNGSFIYNSILFSGLIFSKQNVIMNENILKKYFNSIYIQVAIFCILSSKFGTYFISGPGVVVGGDGENGFGFNDASQNSQIDLKDRSNSISNLAYHKRLFKVILDIEKDISQNIFNNFILEYKIRSIKALILSRKISRSYTKAYWEKLKDLGLKNLWLIKTIYIFIYLIPYKLLLFLSLTIEKIIFKYRKYN
jgi:glycosyltransferase involved in cell wall biosynthesis